MLILAGRIADDALGKLMELLKDPDPYVKRNAMTCIREIIKHEAEQANKLNKLGGPAPIIKYVAETSGGMRLPGIIALRHYAAADRGNAKAIIDANGIIPLQEALLNDPVIFVQSAAACTLGEIAKYSDEHAAPLVEAEIHECLRKVAKRIDSEKPRGAFLTETGGESGGASPKQATKRSPEEGKSMSETRKEEEFKADVMARVDLRKKVFEALGRILENCKKHDTMIDILLEEIDDIKNESTQQLLKVVLQRLSTLIRERGNCWKKFALSGALKKLQEVRMSEDTEVKQLVNTMLGVYIEKINEQYKEELLGLFRKKEEVLKKLESEPING